MSAISIIHAPADAVLCDQIAAALARDGHNVNRDSNDPLSGDNGLDDSLAIVVWSNATAKLARIHEQAREALARGALIPVAVGGAAPNGFEGIPPVDLSGWAGESEDPRWRFVLGEINVVGRRNILKDGAVWAGPDFPEATQAPEEVVVPASSIISDADWPPENSDKNESNDAAAERDASTPPPDYSVSRQMAGFQPVHVVIGASLGLFGVTAVAAVLAPIFLSTPERVARPVQPIAADVTDAPGTPAETPATAAFVTPVSIDDEGNAVATEADRKDANSVAPELREEEGSGELRRNQAPVAASNIADGTAMEELVASVTSEITMESVLTGTTDPPTEEMTAAAASADTFSDCNLCPNMAVLSAGQFSMGSPPGEPARHVSEGPAIDLVLTQPFALGASEVTFAQWQACVDDGGCMGYAPYDHGWGRGDRPVLGVSFEDAKSYAEWLSAKTGNRYRLPSEAEWEYAARAGSAAAFAFGGTISTDQANFNGEHAYGVPDGVNRARTTRAASFAPNAFGLFDMHGNVWEWTADCWADDHGGAPSNGSARGGDCSLRVLKGGAWNTGGWRLRSAHRIGKIETAREYDNGFRVAREMD